MAGGAEAGTALRGSLRMQDSLAQALAASWEPSSNGPLENHRSTGSLDVGVPEPQRPPGR